LTLWFALSTWPFSIYNRIEAPPRFVRLKECCPTGLASDADSLILRAYNARGTFNETNQHFQESKQFFEVRQQIFYFDSPAVAFLGLLAAEPEFRPSGPRGGRSFDFQKNLADGVAFAGRRSKKPRSAISSAGKCMRSICLCTNTLNKIVIAPRLGRSYI
jgi:hypothetical protein